VIVTITPSRVFMVWFIFVSFKMLVTANLCADA
jgi:hypothetical protein